MADWAALIGVRLRAAHGHLPDDERCVFDGDARRRVNYSLSGTASAKPAGTNRRADHDVDFGGKSDSVVEGAYQRAVACMGRSLAWLDPRRLRFHDLPADHGADLA